MGSEKKEFFNYRAGFSTSWEEEEETKTIYFILQYELKSTLMETNEQIQNEEYFIKSCRN